MIINGTFSELISFMKYLNQNSNSDLQTNIAISFTENNNSTLKSNNNDFINLKKPKTNIQLTKTDNSTNKTKRCITSAKTEDQSTKSLTKQPVNQVENSSIYQIEPYETISQDTDKHAAFAIKQLTDNYFLLFYRNSIYDKGSDTTFRSYLFNQPGELVVYKYLSDIKNLRTSFRSLNLALRHNGKNELSLFHVKKLINEYNSLTFL